MICTWTVQYHLGLQILLFVEVMICIILYTTYLFCRKPSDIIHLKINGCVFNGCGLLQMASYRKYSTCQMQLQRQTRIDRVYASVHTRVITLSNANAVPHAFNKRVYAFLQ